MVTYIFLIASILLQLGTMGALLYFYLSEKKAEKVQKILDSQEIVTSEIKQEIASLKKLFDKKQEECELLFFEPYLAITKENSVIVDEDKREKEEVKRGTFHTVVYEKNGYAKLLEGGWIDLSCLSKNFSKPSLQIPSRVIKDKAILYNGPGFGYYKMGTIQQGVVVEVVDKIGPWRKILFKDNFYYIQNINLNEPGAQ